MRRGSLRWKKKGEGERKERKSANMIPVSFLHPDSDIALANTITLSIVKI